MKHSPFLSSFRISLLILGIISMMALVRAHRFVPSATVSVTPPPILRRGTALSLQGHKALSYLKQPGLYDSLHKSLDAARYQLDWQERSLLEGARSEEAVYPLVIDPLTGEVKKLTASDGTAYDAFGISTSISGDTLVIGAYGDTDNGTFSGSVYIFGRNKDGTDKWSQIKKLTPSDGAAEDLFGGFVSLDGDTLAVSARGDDDNGDFTGSVYIFSRNHGGADNWGEVKKLTASDGMTNDFFGSMVSISGDTLVVGAHGDDDNGESSGSAYIFSRHQGGVDNWGQLKKLSASDAAPGDAFGGAVSISGDTLAVGAIGDDERGSETGSAYVFGRSQGGIDNWGEVKKLTASDGAFHDSFGQSVSISGDTLAVGATGDDERGSETGSAYVFGRSQGGIDNWGEVKKLTASDGTANDFFGASLFVNGDTLVVDSPSDSEGLRARAGAAYLFSRNQGGANNWGEMKKLTASDAQSEDQFGRSVSISGNRVVIGAEGDDDNGTDAGSAYIFAVNLPPVITLSGTLDYTANNPLTVIDGNAMLTDDSPNFDNGTLTIDFSAGSTTDDRLVIRNQGTNSGHVGVSGNQITYGGTVIGTLTAGTEGSTPLSVTFNVDATPPAVEALLRNIMFESVSDKPETTVTRIVRFTIEDGEGGIGTATVAINVNAGGALQLGASTYAVNEGAVTVEVTVVRVGGSGGAASVNYATSDGTAQAASDYTATQGTLSFANGETTKTFTVAITNDELNESNETLNITLSDTMGNAALGRPSSAVLTITDNDPAGGTFKFSQPFYSVQESSTGVTVRVERAGDTRSAASVDYATSDLGATQRSDYTIALGTLSFAPGETMKIITILVNDDSENEGTQSHSIVLDNPTGEALLGEPSSATLEINDNAPETDGNPIDDAEAFVRQHYHDFLNREGDNSGIEFWTSEIAVCGSDAGCSEQKRRNVSAAFFLSTEFQETGFLIHRFYNAALDRPEGLPRYREFMRDAQAVGKDVVVGESGWRQQLATNRRTRADEFVSRAEFQALYPKTMTPAEYVEVLYSHAGVMPSAEERQAAIAEFEQEPGARGRVLIRVAENQTLKAREFTRSFVLMQYFGYLRRNPYDQPDNNLGGYNFWLSKLNAFGGNFVDAEMVKAFIISGEYRQRFGR